MVPCGGAGKPEPLGPSKQGAAINFALYAKFAKSVTLVLFDENNKQLAELPVTARTGIRAFSHVCFQVH